MLDIPPEVRVDSLAAVGRPAASPSLAPKSPPQFAYVDRWGAALGGAPPVTARDDAAFRLATFLVTAARDVVDEPPIWEPFRMVNAVDRLMSGVFEDDFLAGMKKELERERQSEMTDRDAFVSWLDDLAAPFAAEGKRRNLADRREPD